MKTITMCAAVLLLLAGCAGGSDGASEDAPEIATACEAAMGQAAAVDEMEDATSDLVPAFTACADLGEFGAAAAGEPDALDGADPELFVSTQCESVPDLAATPVCESIS